MKTDEEKMQELFDRFVKAYCCILLTIILIVCLLFWITGYPEPMFW